MTKAQEKEWAAYSRVHMSRGGDPQILIFLLRNDKQKTLFSTILLELKRTNNHPR